MRGIVMVVALVLYTWPAHAEECDFVVDFGAACPVVQGVGLSRPESVQPHATGWYSSNIGDPANLADGFVTHIDWNGCGTLKWSAGVVLGNPRGIEISGDTMYVADQRRIVVFDLATGDVVDEIQAPAGQVTEWNDPELDAPHHVLYVTDRSPLPADTAGVWAIDLRRGQLEKIVSMGLDTRPNGLSVHKDVPDQGWAATQVGAADQVVYVDARGQIYLRSLKSGATKTYATGLLALDGIEPYARDTFLITENPTNKLWRVQLDANGTVTKTQLAVGGATQYADLGYDRDEGAVAIPTLATNKILFRFFAADTGLLEPCGP